MKMDRLKVARWLQTHSSPATDGFVMWWCISGPWRIFRKATVAEIEQARAYVLKSGLIEVAREVLARHAMENATCNITPCSKTP